MLVKQSRAWWRLQVHGAKITVAEGPPSVTKLLEEAKPCSSIEKLDAFVAKVGMYPPERGTGYNKVYIKLFTTEGEIGPFRVDISDDCPSITGACYRYLENNVLVDTMSNKYLRGII